MSTRSITFVHAGGRNSPVIIAMYRQCDGYFEGHGTELFEFLKGKKLTQGIGWDEKNTANGMECLAAQIVAHFKTEVGGFYLYAPKDVQPGGEAFDYHVFENDGKICLEGKSNWDGKVKEFLTAKPTYKEIAEFVYKSGSTGTNWRRVGLLKEDSDCIFGLDLDDGNKPKKFLFSKILGGESKIQRTNV